MLVEAAQFDRLGTFSYSDEDTSKSFALDAKVEGRTIQNRKRKLMAIQRKISRSRNRSLVGHEADVLIEGLNQAGWDVPVPLATMFAWAPLPPRFQEMGSLAFSKLLLEEANVAVSPGVGFGEYGEGFVRIALVENRQRLRQATRNIKQFLSGRSVAGGKLRERAVAAPAAE